MTDVFTAAKRSEVMSRIRSRGNKDTELRLIQIFRKAGIKGWRRNQKLIGNPDFVFRAAGVAVLVDGCFWHGCPQCYRRPSSNRKYWDAKIGPQPAAGPGRYIVAPKARLACYANLGA